jgi:hypothetical protein
MKTQPDPDATTAGRQPAAATGTGHRIATAQVCFSLAVVAVAGLGFCAPGLFTWSAAGFQPRQAIIPLVQLTMIVLALGPAAAAMGATVPVFGLMARATKSDLSRLYAFNTFGAAIGVLGMAFWALSVFGVELTGVMVACVNFGVALAARMLSVEAASGAPIIDPVDSAPSTSGLSERARYAVVFATLYIYALLGLIVNLVTDFVYTLVDPRIDFESREV